MNLENYKKEVLVFLDQPDTEFLHDKAKNTEDVEVLNMYLKRAKKIFANNISDADQLLNQSKNL